MKRLTLKFVVATSILATSSTICAETKKVILLTRLNYVLTHVATNGDNNQRNHNIEMLSYLDKDGASIFS